MMTWEYRIEPISLGSEGAVAALNGWGSEGWELIAFVPNALGTRGSALILKRPATGTQI